MKEFVTAVKEAAQDEADDKGYPFKVDGRELRCYMPTQSQFAVYVAQTGRHSSTMDRSPGSSTSSSTSWTGPATSTWSTN